MSRLDGLPPDQRAALSLLLTQRKSYAEVASLLGIPVRAVHDRAHAALAMLAPARARAVSSERRAQIGDYLLGQQQDDGERRATRDHLAGDEAARAWAAALAAELKPLGGELPEISSPATGPAAAATQPVEPAHPAKPPSSRLGGALLLAAIAAAAIVAIVLLTGGGSSKKTGSGSTATTKSGPQITQRIALAPSNPGSKALGAVEILAEGTNRAFYIAAEHLQPSRGFFYAIWLYNSPTSSLPLSKSPPVGSDGRLAGGAPLTANLGEYREIVLTRETSERPTHPGPIVLRGRLR